VLNNLLGCNILSGVPFGAPDLFYGYLVQVAVFLLIIIRKSNLSSWIFCIFAVGKHRMKF